MNRRRFLKVLGMIASIPILNKLLGTRSKYLLTPVMDLDGIDKNPGIRAYSGGLQILDYDPTTHSASIDWALPPGSEDGAIWIDTDASNTYLFVDGEADSPVNTWPEALALSRKMNL